MSSLSLKSVIPDLGNFMRMSWDALYERQRVLVRAGLLQSKAGRGPGSGVRATPESVALLLISVLATDSLSETVEATKAAAALKSASEGKRCPITGKRTFLEAFAALLASEEYELLHINFSRTHWFATIGFFMDKAVSEFSPKGISQMGIDPEPSVGLEVSVSLTVPPRSTAYLRG
jgi:hypothetical protein